MTSYPTLDAAQVSQAGIGRKRALMLATLAIALMASSWLFVVAAELAETPVWASALSPLFCFGAAFKCIQAARCHSADDRKAWLCFGIGCLVFGFGEVLWSVYEIVDGIHIPTPSLAELGYNTYPLLIIAGIWLYHDREHSRAFTLVQLSNLGIIFSAIVLAYAFVVNALSRASDSLAAVVLQVSYGIEIMAALCFGLVVATLHVRGRKRIALALTVMSLASLNASYFAFTYTMLAGDYTGANPINTLYLMSFAFMYWAAFEHQHLPPEDLSDHQRASARDWARKWETLLPAAAVAAVIAAAFSFRSHLTEELLSFIAVGALFFVVALGLRNWWGHAVETRLRHEALASQAQVEDANRKLLAEMQTRTQVEEELRQSQKMEALGQLTGGVAHDFNNLLAVVLSNLEMAEECAEAGTDLHEFLHDASDAAQRGASLTQRLLALSRKQALKPESLEVGSLMAGMQNLLERTLGERIRVRIVSCETTWPCAADRAQLESAVLNLALNARDAMPQGGELTLETSNSQIDENYAATHPGVSVGSYVVIAVRDSGQGMSPEILAKVFEPFFTTKGVGEGTGLGLSMVYGFAKQSGGHVAIESEAGAGTVVQLYLPSSLQEAREAEAEELTGTPRGRGESVLVVEDEPAVRKLVIRILRDLGYQVVAAEDGAQALSTLESLPKLDLLLSDVVLPGGISGRALARKIAARRPDVSVLLMSGYAAEVLLRDGELAEGTDLLHKPFRKAELARKVRATLDGGSDGGSATPAA